MAVHAWYVFNTFLKNFWEEGNIFVFILLEVVFNKTTNKTKKTKTTKDNQKRQ